MPAGAAACFLLAAASFLVCFAAWAEAASSALHSVAQAVLDEMSLEHVTSLAEPLHDTVALASGTPQSSDIRRPRRATLLHR